MSPNLIEIGGSVANLVSRLNPIEQMQLVEHLSAIICTRMDTKKSALTVAEGLNKHIKQLIEANYDN